MTASRCSSSLGHITPTTQRSTDMSMTVGEAAKALGLKVYDTALPQEWVDDVFWVTGVYPAGMFVWSYDRGRVLGEPVALTPEATELLETYRKPNAGLRAESPGRP